MIVSTLKNHELDTAQPKCGCNSDWSTAINGKKPYGFLVPGTDSCPKCKYFIWYPMKRGVPSSSEGFLVRINRFFKTIMGKEV